ncbi:MAG: RdgB/HAM1 family non-canonical purine NTP pyrophosphatase [Acidimicrobiia bacterium]
MDRVVAASKNPDKVREIEAVLSSVSPPIRVVHGIDWPEVEETGASLAENALAKARVASRATGLPAIADDTGLEVDALDGAPGVRTSRFAGPDVSYADNVAALLQAMEGRAERAARFRTVIALVTPDGEERVVEGVLEGWITDVPRGESGFGYDPVFEVDGRTLAEIPPAEKNAISHRGRALSALAALLGWT